MRLVFLSLALFISSCSLILPYEEETLCAKGKEGGYCGRIHQVYDKTLEEDGHEALTSYDLCLISSELCGKE